MGCRSTLCYSYFKSKTSYGRRTVIVNTSAHQCVDVQHVNLTGLNLRRINYLISLNTQLCYDRGIMAALAYSLMARLLKGMIKTALWITRMFERCLETLDGKEAPNVKKPMVEPEDKEQVNEESEQKDDVDTVDWEEIPGPNPQPTIQGTDQRRMNATIICPLCTHVMRLKPSGKGGCFYGCAEYPACNGYRNKSDKRPGPMKEVTNLRRQLGDELWEKMEEQKINGTILRWPNPQVRYWDRCWFCGMDPSGHPGRYCPMKRSTGP